jgi:hypothetical protein
MMKRVITDILNTVETTAKFINLGYELAGIRYIPHDDVELTFKKIADVVALGPNEPVDNRN